MTTILVVLLFVAFIAWLIAVFARGRNQAPLSDMAFFATGIVILLCLLLVLFAHFFKTGSVPL